MNRPFVLELTRDEAQTAWNAMEFSFGALVNDMSLGTDERAELGRLEELKDRVRKQLDAEEARQGKEAS